MCGFVIAIGNFSETELKAATQSISYRGPDDTDFFFNDHAKIKIGFNIIRAKIISKSKDNCDVINKVKRHTTIANKNL